ncbi:MAG: hypothetical protein IT210_03635 [Armatimonadetes bacterium]|nr:hypothetical protein [Armatimonadota bacterium]
MSVSPWAESVTLASPDGKQTACIARTDEIAMGAPTSGELHLSGGLQFPSGNSSIVWSEDSLYLAASQWAARRDQRLLIVRVPDRQFRYAPEVYRVLELQSFSGGIVRGIDSPVYMPAPVAVDIRRIEW